MTLAIGTRIGRYEIRAKIAEGGMGEVYRARDEKLNRDVAIKVLPASLSQDEDRLRRFGQEAEAAGTLNHPNILAVHDVGMQDGAPYVVSELLEGETLRERLGGPPVPLRKAIDYAVQIARGLAAAHARNIVHRDLKPENIFIAGDGQVKILDFGLAKLIEPVGAGQMLTDLPTRKLNTTPGTVMGTLGYMSPEQVDGKPVDYRSDIFSFGVVLYEMLAGRRAFPQRETLRETLHAIAKEDPPVLSELVPRVSPSLEKVVERCLEKKPEDRFQSTRDLAFALEALSGAGTTSHPELSTAPNLDLSTSPAIAAPPSHRLWKMLVVAAMLAAVAFSVGAFILGREREQHRHLHIVSSPFVAARSGMRGSRLTVIPSSTARGGMAIQLTSSRCGQRAPNRARSASPTPMSFQSLLPARWRSYSIGIISASSSAEARWLACHCLVARRVKSSMMCKRLTGRRTGLSSRWCAMWAERTNSNIPSAKSCTKRLDGSAICASRRKGIGSLFSITKCSGTIADG